MKGSLKFIVTVIAVCLTVGVLTVGIYAATNVNMGIQSQIGWDSIGVEMDLYGKVTGNKSSDIISSSFSDHLTSTTEEDSKTLVWSIGTLNFDLKIDEEKQEKYCEPIVIRFGLTNTSQDFVNIYYNFSSITTNIQNIDYKYQLAHGVLGSNETWETNFFSNKYSGNMQVGVESDQYLSVEKADTNNYVAPGETAVFEIRLTILSFTQNVNASFNANLLFRNTPIN